MEDKELKDKELDEVTGGKRLREQEVYKLRESDRTIPKDA